MCVAHPTLATVTFLMKCPRMKKNMTSNGRVETSVLVTIMLHGAMDELRLASTVRLVATAWALGPEATTNG